MVLLTGYLNNILCDYRHTELEPFMKKHPEANTEPLDIEDLVKIGQVQGPCPYFLSREMTGGAELVFMPYQYLLDAKTRIGLDNITWEDAILIFDEAHNLEVSLAAIVLQQQYSALGGSYMCESGTLAAAQGTIIAGRLLLGFVSQRRVHL